MEIGREAELVDGNLVERGTPDNAHSLVQFLILSRLSEVSPSHSLHPRPELSLRVAANTYRIPDISVFTSAPKDLVPDRPPLLVIEIVSADDRHSVVMQKLEEFLTWGVPNIWSVDPIRKRLFKYNQHGLQEASSLVLAEYSFKLTPADLFSELV